MDTLLNSEILHVVGKHHVMLEMLSGAMYEGESEMLDDKEVGLDFFKFAPKILEGQVRHFFFFW